MATPTNAVSVPLDVYLKTSYRPDCDWMDGEVRERKMGEAPHSAVQKFLINYLSAREGLWGITVWPEQRVQTSATHFRVPDLCATRDTAPFERILKTAPVLCVEVMSPDDRLNELFERAEDYLAMGVESVWIVDPHKRQAWVATRGGANPVLGDLTVAGWEIAVPLAEVFAYLDKLEARK
jgi:Uma2 family endonuclease